MRYKQNKNSNATTVKVWWIRFNCHSPNSTSTQPQINSTELGLTGKWVCKPPSNHPSYPNPTLITRSPGNVCGVGCGDFQKFSNIFTGISISAPMTIRWNVVYLKIIFDEFKTFHTHTIRCEISWILRKLPWN